MVKIAVGAKVKRDKLKSQATHPDKIKRFEELNRLISMYWNDEELLKKSKKGEEAYEKIKANLEK